MTRTHARPRRGATVLEVAIVLPLAFFLVFALVIGAMGIFRYQEVATLAREAARYGSTHGYQYRKDSNLATGSENDWKEAIYKNAIEPRLIGLDKTRLTVEVSYPDVINQPGKPDNWPGSKVEVTVRYRWLPEMFLVGPIELSSTSSMPITN